MVARGGGGVDGAVGLCDGVGTRARASRCARNGGIAVALMGLRVGSIAHLVASIGLWVGSLFWCFADSIGVFGFVPSYFTFSRNEPPIGRVGRVAEMGFEVSICPVSE